MDLTSKQEEILTLSSCGLKYPQIAELLGISTRTVQNHMARIFEKNGVNSRFEAVMLYLGSKKFEGKI